MKKYAKLLYSGILFLVAFIVYVITASPTIGFTDSGELASVCIKLGIGHPTGYPLFTIIGHLWSYLPLPISKIHSMNIFASFATALSAVVFFLLAYEIVYFVSTRKSKAKKVNQAKGKGKEVKVTPKVVVAEDNSYYAGGMAFVVAGLYMFARTIWAQAVAIEVYSLHLLMINIVLLFLVKGVLYKEQERNYLMIAALALGLSFANHMTTILLIPTVIFVFFKRFDDKFDFSKERLKLFATLAIPFFIGLSLYLYLPLRSMGQPEFNWGYVSRGIDKLLYHIQGKQYQVWMFTGSEVWGVNFQKFYSALPWQLGWLGLIPMIWGMIFCWIKSRDIFWVLVILVLSCLFYSLNYSIHDIDSYFATAFVALLIFAGIGLYYLGESNKKYSILVAAILPIISFMANIEENNNSNEYQVAEYTRILTENLQPNAIVISAQWDYYCSAFWYMQRVEGYRKDVSLVEKELMRRTWYPYQLKKWYPELVNQSETELQRFMKDLEQFESGKPYNQASIQANFIGLINSFIDKSYGKRPIYITLDILQTDADIAKNYEKIPEGFAFRLEKERKIYPVSLDKIDVRKFNASLKGKEGHLYDGIKTTAATNITNIARYATMTGQMELAKRAWELAYTVDPNNPTIIHGRNSIVR
jgi:hypothetical protein